MFDLLNALAMLEKEDGVIGFPTETVYGLGCHLHKPRALEKIHRLKGKETPLILLGRHRDDLIPFIECTSPVAMAVANQLMEQHWPGPLTLILPKSREVPEGVTGSYPTIGIRIPKADMVLDLLTLLPAGVLATTSACRYGEPPAVSGNIVYEGFGEALDFLLYDDLAVEDKIPSTLVAIEADGTVQVLRSGPIMLH